MTAALGWAGSASMFVIVRNLETLSSVWSRHYLASAQVASHDYQAVHVYLLRALDSLGPNPECRITPDAGKPTSPALPPEVDEARALPSGGHSPKREPGEPNVVVDL